MDFEKKKKRNLGEAHKSEHTVITNRERALPLAPMGNYNPGQILEVTGHTFMSLSSHFSCTN